MTSEIIINSIVLILGAAILSLFFALILQLTSKMVAKFKPPYGVAYKATFLCTVIPFLICLYGVYVIDAYELELPGNFLALYLVLVWAIGFFIQFAIYARIIKHTETGAIGYGKACLISLVLLIFQVLIFGVIGLCGMVLLSA